jgi:hypothetical protein
LLAAAVVALAGVIWFAVRSTGSKLDTVAALPTAAPIVQPSRALAAPPETAVKPPSIVEATATPVTSGQAPGLVESAKSALLGTENTVLVTVRVSPSSAVVIQDGQRVGTGEVTVKVARGIRTRLFARLDGYQPRTIVIDGTKASVNIVLYRPQTARATVARKPPAQEAIASSPESAGEPSAGASKRAGTAAADAPSNSASASDPEPSKRSPSESTSTVRSDPMSDVNPY